MKSCEIRQSELLMAVFRAVTFQWHLYLRGRENNNESVTKSPRISFPQYNPIHYRSEAVQWEPSNITITIIATMVTTSGVWFGLVS